MKINAEDFKSDAPRLELNIYKKSVFGHDGCNSFTGGIEVENGTIIFGDLARTLMACMDNTEISAKIRKTISGKKLAFKIENNHLIFFDNTEKIMILKHID